MAYSIREFYVQNIIISLNVFQKETHRVKCSSPRAHQRKNPLEDKFKTFRRVPRGMLTGILYRMFSIPSWDLTWDCGECSV